VFLVSSLSFLGHKVDAAGISPLQKHVTALQQFPPPSDLKQLQRFLGMINFYRRFLPGIAGILQPLTDLLRGNPKTLLWSGAAATAFVAAKEALLGCTPLAHPLPDAVISLAVDASDTHVGGVLQQLASLSTLSKPSWQPLSFFSRKLSEAELKYSTFDRELLAAYSAVKHFRFLLEGRRFTLLTDHKPLVSAMTRVSPPSSNRVGRHLAYVSEFTTDLRYIEGKHNVVADALSRPSAVLPQAVGTPKAPPQRVSAPTAARKAPVAALPLARRPWLQVVAEMYQRPVSQLAAPKGSPGGSHKVSGSAADQKLSVAAPLHVSALPVAVSPIDFVQMATLQASCQSVTEMCNSPVLFVVEREVQGVKLWGDVSSGPFLTLVPKEM